MLARVRARALRPLVVRRFAEGRNLPTTVETAPAYTLQDVATLQPRPPAIIEEPPARGFRGYKPLAVFLLCNALPLAAAVWYMRTAVERKKTEETELQTTADVLREASAVVRTSGAVFCLSVGGAIEAQKVEPHFPEKGTVRLSEALDSFPALQNVSAAQEVLAERPGGNSPFQVVHFAVSGDSALIRRMSEDERRVSLLYHSPSRGKSLVLQGMAVLVDDPGLQQYYWKSRWAELKRPVLLKVYVDGMDIRRDGTGDGLHLNKVQAGGNDTAWVVD